MCWSTAGHIGNVDKIDNIYNLESVDKIENIDKIDNVNKIDNMDHSPSSVGQEWVKCWSSVCQVLV